MATWSTAPYPCLGDSGVGNGNQRGERPSEGPALGNHCLACSWTLHQWVCSLSAAQEISWVRQALGAYHFVLVKADRTKYSFLGTTRREACGPMAASS